MVLTEKDKHVCVCVRACCVKVPGTRDHDSFCGLPKTKPWVGLPIHHGLVVSRPVCPKRGNQANNNLDSPGPVRFHELSVKFV